MWSSFGRDRGGWVPLRPFCDWRRWAVGHPALAGRAGIGDVVEAVARHGDDEVLKGLLLLARAGEELAARAALQAMLGAAVRLARRTVAYAGGDLEEATSRAVAA